MEEAAERHLPQAYPPHKRKALNPSVRRGAESSYDLSPSILHIYLPHWICYARPSQTILQLPALSHWPPPPRVNLMLEAVRLKKLRMPFKIQDDLFLAIGPFCLTSLFSPFYKASRDITQLDQERRQRKKAELTYGGRGSDRSPWIRWTVIFIEVFSPRPLALMVEWNNFVWKALFWFLICFLCVFITSFAAPPPIISYGDFTCAVRK